MTGGLPKESESLAEQGSACQIYLFLQDQFFIQDEMIFTLALSGERCRLWSLTLEDSGLWLTS
jgi:hypothetical protein